MKSIFERDLVVLMAKEPRPGFSKTRLARGIGEASAFELAEAFVLDTFRTVENFSRDGERRSALVAFAPVEEVQWFVERCADWATLIPQPEEDLGARMLAAVGAGFAHGAERCVLVGTDCPQLAPDRLSEAFDALESADVVIGPSTDGGYYLMGMRAAHEDLFHGIEWSTATVLQATRERAEALGLVVTLLEAETDVDEAEDLAPLRTSLAARPGVAPETARRLRALGLDSPE